VIALGDEAVSVGIQFIETGITVQGRDQSISSGGARLAVRVHNVIVDMNWAGADYKVRKNGVLTHVRGISRESADRLISAIAMAIIMRLR
jgi:hypothetical protein